MNFAKNSAKTVYSLLKKFIKNHRHFFLNSEFYE